MALTFHRLPMAATVPSLAAFIIFILGSRRLWQSPLRYPPHIYFTTISMETTKRIAAATSSQGDLQSRTSYSSSNVLCSREEVRQGVWVPITLKAPPYIPLVSSCYKEHHLNGSWDTFTWQPRGSQQGGCEFSFWDRDLFCQLAFNKTIALLGDSLTREHYKSLVRSLGHEVARFDLRQPKNYTDQLWYDHPKGKVGYVCNGMTRIAFRRTSNLGRLNEFITLFQPDILILNRGAHYVSNDKFINQSLPLDVKLLQMWQRKCHLQGRDCLMIWRTTVPGHPECWKYKAPVNNRTEMEALVANLSLYSGKLRASFNWWNMQQQNMLVLQVLQKSDLIYEIMPAYDLGILRPDDHTLFKKHGIPDCLHNCDPGKADVYNQLLLHMMRLHKVEQSLNVSL